MDSKKRSRRGLYSETHTTMDVSTERHIDDDRQTAKKTREKCEFYYEKTLTKQALAEEEENETERDSDDDEDERDELDEQERLALVAQLDFAVRERDISLAKTAIHALHYDFPAMTAALLLCAEVGAAQIADLILNSCVDAVLAKDANGNSAVMVAARHGHVCVLQSLCCHLRRCGRTELVERENCVGDTALLLAVQHGHMVCIMYLYNGRYVDLWEESTRRETPLMRACAHDQLSVVRWLCSSMRSTENFAWTHENANRETALLCAARSGSVSVLAMLHRERLADVWMCNSRGVNVFLHACTHNQVQVVDLLCRLFDDSEDTQASLTLHTRDARGNGAILLAAHAGSTAVLRYLAQSECFSRSFDASRGMRPALWNSCDSALMLACEQGHLETVQFLTQDDVFDVTECNTLGYSAFHYALPHEHVAQFLQIQAKIDLNAPLPCGETYLQQALRRGEEAAVKTLCGFDELDLLVVDERGHTPLASTAREKYLPGVKLLLDAQRNRISSTAQRENICSALCDMEISESLNASQSLLCSTHGHSSSTLRQLSKEQRTVLQILVALSAAAASSQVQAELLCFAAYHGMRCAVRALLGLSGGSLSEKDTDGGYTLLMRLIAHSSWTTAEHIRMLINLGADVHLANDYGETAPMIATQKGRRDLREALTQETRFS